MRKLAPVVAGIVVLGVVASMTLASADPAPSQKAPSLRALLRSAPEARSDGGDWDQRLVLVERNFTETFIQHPPAGFNQGDAVVGHAALHRHGKRVGQIETEAVFTLVGRQQIRALATFAATIRGNEINGAGTLVFTENLVDFKFSITGGTGRWDDAGGTARVVVRGDVARWVFEVDHLG